MLFKGIKLFFGVFQLLLHFVELVRHPGERAARGFEAVLDVEFDVGVGHRIGNVHGGLAVGIRGRDFQQPRVLDRLDFYLTFYAGDQRRHFVEHDFGLFFDTQEQIDIFPEVGDQGFPGLLFDNLRLLDLVHFEFM